ncbi:MAG: ABC transporter permease [Halodesulfurarchaeum sp.]
MDAAKDDVGRFADRPVKRITLGTIAIAISGLTLVPLLFLAWTSVWTGYPGEAGASFTLQPYISVYLEGFFNVPMIFVHSLFIAVMMTLTGLIFGLTFAWLFVETNLPTKGAMELVLLSGQAIPGYIFGIMYIIAYRPDEGIFTGIIASALGIESIPISVFSPWGIGFIAGVNVISTSYLIAVPALQDLGPAYEEVSRIHGASLSETIRSITLPLIKPATLSAALSIFLYGMGEFATVSILGARRGFDVYSTTISQATRIRFPPAYSEAAALSISLLLMTGVFVYYYRRVTSRKQEYMTLTGQNALRQTWDLGAWRWPIAGVLWIVMGLIWILPILGLFTASLHGTWTGVIRPAQFTLANYIRAVTSPTIQDAFVNSLLVSGGAATLGTALAMGLAYYTERTDAPFRGLVDFLSLTPLAVPGIITGTSLIFMSLWVGKLPVVNLYGTLLIIIIGSVIVYLPVASRIAIGNTVQIHSYLEEAARIEGATWLQQMRNVFLPLTKNTTIILWFFLAIHIFQLLSIPWMTYTSDTVVIPVKLFQLYISQPAMALISAISCIFIGLTVVGVVLLRLSGITFYELGQQH